MRKFIRFCYLGSESNADKLAKTKKTDNSPPPNQAFESALVEIGEKNTSLEKLLSISQRVLLTDRGEVTRTNAGPVILPPLKIGIATSSEESANVLKEIFKLLNK